jgi:hypothetical protein
MQQQNDAADNADDPHHVQYSCEVDGENHSHQSQDECLKCAHSLMYGAMAMHTSSTQLPDGTRLIVTGRSPWIERLWDKGPVGDYARWLVHNKNERLRAEVNGWDQVVPGPWPFGLRMAALPGIYFQKASLLADAGGWVLTAWIIARVLRRR